MQCLSICGLVLIFDTRLLWTKHNQGMHLVCPGTPGNENLSHIIHGQSWHTCSISGRSSLISIWPDMMNFLHQCKNWEPKTYNFVWCGCKADPEVCRSSRFECLKWSNPMTICLTQSIQSSISTLNMLNITREITVNTCTLKFLWIVIHVTIHY